MTTLKVQRRNMETKAKKLRREGYVTGNLFGKEIEGSIPLQIEKQEAERIERECMKGSQLYLELDGKTYESKRWITVRWTIRFLRWISRH